MLSEASENKGLTSKSFPMVEGWKGDVGDCNGPPETNPASEWKPLKIGQKKAPGKDGKVQLQPFSAGSFVIPQIEDWLDYRPWKNAFLGLNLGDHNPSTSEDQLILNAIPVEFWGSKITTSQIAPKLPSPVIENELLNLRAYEMLWTTTLTRFCILKPQTARRSGLGSWGHDQVPKHQVHYTTKVDGSLPTYCMSKIFITTPFQKYQIWE